MRFFLLTTLTMVAFAVNSVLNRMALTDGWINATSFGTIRLVSGALMLAGLSLVLRGGIGLRGPGRLIGVISLLVYIYGFSLAYNALDAGLGALLLFGMVQITMFVGGLLRAETIPPRRWVGALLAFSGLVWLFWPGTGLRISVPHGLLMAAGGVGWGVYSLAGRRSGDALRATTANFVLAVPPALLLTFVLPGEPLGTMIETRGILLAVLSGAVTSGLGYALWYSILPYLASSVAAVAQLTVPIIATVGGLLFLGESVGLAFVVASLLVLGGVAVSVAPLGSKKTNGK